MLKMRNPNSVKICTILDKPSRRKADIQPDYEGFQVPDEFVVGYGLDYDEKYRNLPYVGVLKPEVYAEVISHTINHPRTGVDFFAIQKTPFQSADPCSGAGGGADGLVGAGRHRLLPAAHPWNIPR